MDEFKLCSNGEFLPVSLPCAPPYSGPYYYYPYDKLPPEQSSTDYSASITSSKGKAPISSGAVAGIIIAGGFIFFFLCLLAFKCRSRFIIGSNRGRGSSRNGAAGDQLSRDGGDNMVVNVVGCGLEEKLVNLLPVCEYVGSLQEGKERLQQECAVCLSLFEEKEIVRVLPKCHHIFHIPCIDKWFEAHTNCPLCRERITLQTIQLSFISDKIDDLQHPLDPSLCNIMHQDHLAASDHGLPQQPFNDQPPSSPPPRHVCVHDHDHDHDHLQHPHPHQDIILAIPSAANPNYPHIARGAGDDQPARYTAAGAHRVADDQKSAELPLIRVHRLQERVQVPAGDHKCVLTKAQGEERPMSLHDFDGALQSSKFCLLRRCFSTGSMQVESTGRHTISPHRTKAQGEEHPMSLHDFDRALHSSKFCLLRKSFSTGSMQAESTGRHTISPHRSGWCSPAGDIL